VSDKEIQAVVAHVRAQQQPNYLSLETVLKQDATALPDADDELFQQILTYLQEVDEVSISMVQRRFRIGYNRSARIIEALEAQGRILPAEGSRPRRVVRE
jgi:S-DNA-T family DNA segregation ATPase FtsK/SpoIIIE